MVKVMGPVTDVMQSTMLQTLDNLGRYPDIQSCSQLMSAMQSAVPNSVWGCAIYKCGNHQSWSEYMLPAWYLLSCT